MGTIINRIRTYANPINWESRDRRDITNAILQYFKGTPINQKFVPFFCSTLVFMDLEPSVHCSRNHGFAVFLIHHKEPHRTTLKKWKHTEVFLISFKIHFLNKKVESDLRENNDIDSRIKPT